MEVHRDAEAHLAVAGEGGVIEQEVGTKEEDDGVKQTQARPVEEDGPAEEGVLCYVSEGKRQEGGRLSNGNKFKTGEGTR